MEDGKLKLGLEVLNKVPTEYKVRKKNPICHVYKQKDGSYRFKAIVHEELDGIPSTRQSFKAMINIIPIDNLKPKKMNTCDIFCVSVILTTLVFFLGLFYYNNIYTCLTIAIIQLFQLLTLFMLCKNNLNRRA